MLGLVVLRHPLLLFFWAVCTAWLFFYFHGRKGFSLFIWTSVPALFIAVLNPLTSQRGAYVLIYLGDRAITAEAVLYGVSMSLTFLITVLLLAIISKSMTPGKWLDLTHRFSPVFAMLVITTLRMIPLFQREFSTLYGVQKTKPSASAKSRGRVYHMKLLTVFFQYVLEKSVLSADAMNARGYGSGPRTSYRPIRWTWRDRNWLIGSLVLLLCSLVTSMFGGGSYQVYPRAESIVLTPIDCIALFCWIAYTLWPLAVERRHRH